jgi:symplekin
MSLFFALCTKKHALLQQLFEVYGRASKAVKQAVHRHIPILSAQLAHHHQSSCSLLLIRQLAVRIFSCW